MLSSLFYFLHFIRNIRWFHPALVITPLFRTEKTLQSKIRKVNFSIVAVLLISNSCLCSIEIIDNFFSSTVLGGSFGIAQPKNRRKFDNKKMQKRLAILLKVCYNKARSEIPCVFYIYP